MSKNISSAFLRQVSKVTNDQNVSANKKRNAHGNIFHIGRNFSGFLSQNRTWRVNELRSKKCGPFCQNRGSRLKSLQSPVVFVTSKKHK